MLDNFGGAAAWDAYCTMQQAILEYDMENTKCKDCEHFSRDNNICEYGGDKVDPEKFAVDYGCEEVIPR